MRHGFAPLPGVSVESISFTELKLPTMENDPYVLDVSIESSDAARAATSLRNANSYGILRSGIRNEAKMDFIGFDFITNDGAVGRSAWSLGFRSS